MARIEFLEECGSTNLVLRDTSYKHGDAVVAFRQTAGRGQRGNKWESAPGENLTFSMVLEPSFLPAAGQFMLSEAVALGVTDMFAGYGMDTRIKWTNDIYHGDRKVTGMLIEHDLKGAYLSRSIVGIGVNINQAAFPEWIPNPASMHLITGGTYDIREVFRACYEAVMERYGMLETEADSIRSDYHARIYRLGEPHRFFIPGHGEVTGTIREVRPSGELMVETDGGIRGFLFREIEFII